MRRAQKLTPTQRIILEAAAKATDGVIVMGYPDRKGTRVARQDAMGHPIIIAYGSPEMFLKSRGFLEPSPARPHAYRITDLGRKALTHRRRRR